MKISLFDSKIGGNWKRAQRYSQIESLKENEKSEEEDTELQNKGL
jgi:hypothetical protein